MSAPCALKCRRKPYEKSQKCSSYMASNSIATARCTILSSSTSMASGRWPPSPLGIHTRLAGCARYSRFSNRRCKSVILSLRLTRYSVTVISSMPAAASLRSWEKASSRKSSSIRCAKVVNTMLASRFDCSAIRASFVETVSELNVPPAFPWRRRHARHCLPALFQVLPWVDALGFVPLPACTGVGSSAGRIGHLTPGCWLGRSPLLRRLLPRRREALPSSRITLLLTCPALRPRWCPARLPWREQYCCLPVTGCCRLWVRSPGLILLTTTIRFSEFNDAACVLASPLLRTPPLSGRTSVRLPTRWLAFGR